MILNDVISGIANYNRGATRVCGGWAKAIASDLRGALPEPKDETINTFEYDHFGNLLMEKYCDMSVTIVGRFRDKILTLFRTKK